MREHLKDAKGVLIYPQVLKAGFFLGGSGGTGVLLARDGKTGEWATRFLHDGFGQHRPADRREAAEVVSW